MVSILGANSVSGGYEVSNSLRLNDGDTPKLAITPNASNRKTWTFSAWVKRSSLSSNQRILSITGTNDFLLRFRGDDKLSFIDGSITSELITATKVFRDTSAWYHIVIVLDTTQGTASNRAKLYVNGYQETDLVNNSGGSAAYPSQNADGLINSNVLHTVGCRDTSGTVDQNVDGYLAEVHFIDGTAKSPTDFGEFDDNGVWIPKKYTGTYGTNGFFFEFKQTGTSQNASGIGADTSGNDNHFAVSNLAATDVTTDSPTNNFCTLNPLTQSEPGNSPTFAEGNLKITMANFDTESVMATMGVTQGKWYWEVKGGWTTGNWGFGIEKASSSNIGFNVGYTSTSYSFSQGGYKQNNSSASQIDSGLGNTDIIGYALDLDNGYFNFSQNGVWYNGSASESTTFDTSNHDFTSLDFGSEFVMPTISGFADTSITTEINFGNPTFAISSGNADANGYGSFEYAPPSGYYALCTKNLAEFG